MTDAPDHIREAENALRDLIEDRLSRRFGPGWIEQCGLSATTLGQLRSRLEAERTSRPLQISESRLLYYSNPLDLATIVEANWAADFESLFVDRARVTQFVSLLNELRRAVAHQRPLWAYEMALARGVSGYFRQALASSRGQLNEVDQFFPRFERVVDNFGNDISHPESVFNSKQVLRAGDELSYIASAYNPYADRTLQFQVKLGWHNGRFGDPVVAWSESARMGPIRLELGDMVRELRIEVELRLESSAQRGMTGVDDRMVFQYVGAPG